MKVTTLVLALLTLVCVAAPPASAKNTILVNRIGPSASELFVANADGTGERKLFPATGFDYDASFSADGKWIVFTSERNSSADIYRVGVDGSGLEQLTNNSGFNDAASLSPDGKQVVFYEMPVEDTFAARGFGAPASQIVSVDVATGDRKEHTSGPGLKISPQFLTAERVGYLAKTGPTQHGGLAFSSGERGPEGWIRNPSWSLDGKLVVYQKFIYASRQSQPMFAKDPEFDLRFSGEFPTVSSTGKVALSPFGEITAVPRLDAIALSVMDLDGGNAKKIFSDKAGGAFAPAWSPDGQWIAFGLGAFFTDRETKPARLMMVRADGSGKRDLTSGPINSGFPSWSPDGKRIAYRVWSQEEHGLRILNMEDGSVTKLTTDYDNFPMWSPKGDRIGFTRAGKNAFDIFTVRPDGTDVKQLTDAPGNDAHCAWSPDSQYIVFSSSRLGFRDEGPLYDGAPQPYAELFVMNADGSGQRPITDDKWEQGTPAWVPKVLAERNRTQSSR